MLSAIFHSQCSYFNIAVFISIHSCSWLGGEVFRASDL